jgi:hypothetical protein
MPPTVMLPLSKPSRTNPAAVVVAEGAVSVVATASVVTTAVDPVLIETDVAVAAEVGSVGAAVESVEPVNPATPQALTTTSSNRPTT